MPPHSPSTPGSTDPDDENHETAAPPDQQSGGSEGAHGGHDSNNRHVGVTVGDRDGGVSARVTRRCRVASLVLVAVGAGLFLVVLMRSWDLGSAVLSLISLAALIFSAVLIRRAAQWLAISRCRASGWRAMDGRAQLAVVGPPRSLSPVRPGAPIRRRLGPSIIPIHAKEGASPGSGAIIVHARADGTALAEGDEVVVLRLTQRRTDHQAPILIDRDSATTEPGRHHVPGAPKSRSTAGRFALIRQSDGEVFLATTHLTDTW